MEQIADYHNKSKNCETPLSIEDIRGIKNLLADTFNDSEEDLMIEATASDFEILRFYGVYSDCYVALIRDHVFIYPTDIPSYVREINGVPFYYNDYYSIFVFRKEVIKNNGGNLI